MKEAWRSREKGLMWNENEASAREAAKNGTSMIHERAKAELRVGSWHDPTHPKCCETTETWATKVAALLPSEACNMR